MGLRRVILWVRSWEKRNEDVGFLMEETAYRSKHRAAYGPWSRFITPLLWLMMIVLFFYALSTHVLFAQQRASSESSTTYAAVSLETLIQGVLSQSSQVRILTTQITAAKVQSQKVEGAFDPELFSQVRLASTDPDPFPRTESPTLLSSQWKSGVRSRRKTGTTFEASFAAGTGEVPAAGASSRGPVPAVAGTDGDGEDTQDFFVSEVTAAVTQNLWKNAWGKEHDLTVELAQSRVAATRYQVQDQIEDWVIKVVDAFFGLKRSQLHEQSARQRKEKNEKVYETAQLLFRRGNVERADLYQIQVRMLRAVEAHKDAQLALHDQWHAAMMELGLGSTAYANMDPAAVNLTYGALSPAYGRKCGSLPTWQKLAGYRHKAEQNRMALTQADLAEQAHEPSLDLSLGMRVENREEQVADALVDSLSLQQGTWWVMLSYRRPLSRHVAKAEIWQNQIRVQEADLQQKTFLAQKSAQWKTVCGRLQRLYERQQAYRRIVEFQSEAARLDRARFEIGKKDFFQATEAEIAEIGALFERDVVTFDMEKEKWKLAYFLGELPSLINLSLK